MDYLYWIKAAVNIEFKSVVNVHEQSNFILPTILLNYFTGSNHSNTNIVTCSSTLNRIIEAGTLSTLTNPAARVLQFPDRDLTAKLSYYITMFIAVFNLLICPTLKLRKCCEVLSKQILSLFNRTVKPFCQS